MRTIILLFIIVKAAALYPCRDMRKVRTYCIIKLITLRRGIFPQQTLTKVMGKEDDEKSIRGNEDRGWIR